MKTTNKELENMIEAGATPSYFLGAYVSKFLSYFKPKKKQEEVKKYVERYNNDDYNYLT